MYTQKSPVHTQKSPAHTQKCPVNTQNGPVYTRNFEMSSADFLVVAPLQQDRASGLREKMLGGKRVCVSVCVCACMCEKAECIIRMSCLASGLFVSFLVLSLLFFHSCSFTHTLSFFHAHIRVHALSRPGSFSRALSRALWCALSHLLSLPPSLFFFHALARSLSLNHTHSCTLNKKSNKMWRKEELLNGSGVERRRASKLSQYFPTKALPKQRTILYQKSPISLKRLKPV